MNEFINNVRADLSDRRLVPVVAVVVVALLAALGYAVFGAGSSSPGASAEPSPVAPPTGPLAVVPAQNTPTEALAETTSGVAAQHRGAAHDPFAPLPGSVKTSTTSTTTSTSSSSSSSSGGGSPSSSKSPAGGETGSNPSAPSKESKPSHPKAVYAASVLFGELPPGVEPANAKLTPYPSLTKPTPLPNAKENRIEFVGVTLAKSGKGALFNLNGEVILHGPGTCLPSSTQCEVLKLQENKSEQLEYLPVTGPAVTFELRLVSIKQASASASAAAHIARAQGRTARRLFAPWTGALRYSALRYAAGSGAFMADGHSAVG